MYCMNDGQCMTELPFMSMKEEKQASRNSIDHFNCFF